MLQPSIITFYWALGEALCQIGAVSMKVPSGGLLRESFRQGCTQKRVLAASVALRTCGQKVARPQPLAATLDSPFSLLPRYGPPCLSI